MYLQTKQKLFGLIKESTQSHLYSRGKIHYVFGNPSFVNNFIRKAHFNAIPLVVAQSYLLLLLLWKKLLKLQTLDIFRSQLCFRLLYLWRNNKYVCMNIAFPQWIGKCCLLFHYFLKQHLLLLDVGFGIEHKWCVPLILYSLYVILHRVLKWVNFK